MRRSLMLLAAAAMLSFAAYGEDNKPTVPAATTPAAPTEQTSDLDRVICKTLPPPTGTRFGGKTVCQTKKQWLALTVDVQDTLTKAQTVGGGR